LRRIPLNKNKNWYNSLLIQFWKTITYSSPIYAADGFNTFMDQTAGPWNFNNLDSVLKYAFGQLVEGIN
jgi:hypothetical protein